jgi:histidyl-tRNA synthetase
MSEYQKPRGTQDIFFANADKFYSIIKTAELVAKKHNFHNIKTPTFEYSSLFERNIGEDTDAVSKELYRFKDQGNRELALRPEFTAGVVRAFLENNELKSYPIPLRLFSYGQLFRYDRPKKGRYREFHQINFEFFNEKEDVLTLGVAIEVLNKLGVLHKTKLLINYLGDAKTPYTNAVKKYFSTHINSLSQVSKSRLEKNPLRILDSKEKEDIALLQSCPKISEFYSDNDKTKLGVIVDFLQSVPNLNFEIDQNLVRGLDYYTGMVFEFIAPIAEDNSNLTVLGGGRYDNLVSQMGGKQTSAIGFGGGIERLILLLEEPRPYKKIFIINTIESFNILDFIQNLEKQFQETSFQEIVTEKNRIGKMLHKLSEIQNSFAIIIGEKEIENNKATLKDLTQNKEIQEITI